MKVKTSEALSYGKYTVGTKESMNGYWEYLPENIKNVVVFRSDDSEEWVNILNELIAGEVPKYSDELYGVFNQIFTYDVMLESFKKRLVENE